MQNVKAVRLLAHAGEQDEAARLGALRRVASLLTDDVLDARCVDPSIVVPSLLRLRRDADVQVRRAAVSLLGRIGSVRGGALAMRRRMLRALRRSAEGDLAVEVRFEAALSVRAIESSARTHRAEGGEARGRLAGAHLGKLSLAWTACAWHLDLEARCVKRPGHARARETSPLRDEAAPTKGRASDKLIAALHAHVVAIAAMSERDVLAEEGPFEPHRLQVRALLRDAACRAEAASGLEQAVLLAIFSPFWLRPFDGWPPDTSVHAIAAHLLARYEVPGRLRWTWAWYCENVRSAVRTSYGEYPLKRLVWFILLGAGASLRASGLVFGWFIPKGFVHAYASDEEMRRAMVCAVGGTREDAARLYAMDPMVDPTETADDVIAEISRRTWMHATLADAPARAGAFYEADVSLAAARRAHWFGAARWLIRYRDALDAATSQRVLAWAQEQFTARTVNEIADLSVFTHFWQDLSLNEARTLGWPAEVTWRARGLSRLLGAHGDLWAFVELTSLGALRVEGALMHHCVGLYGDLCEAGTSAILSVRRGTRHVATVQIDPRTLKLGQMRGFANRPLDEHEDFVVAKWRTRLLRARLDAQRTARCARSSSAAHEANDGHGLEV